MRKILTISGLGVGLSALLGACGYVDAYEEAVHGWEPTYCYQSIGKAVCFREPYHRDQRRLVNYFGPHPSRYEAPEPPELQVYSAPKMIDYWVKDAEPIPRPAPVGPVAALPWLDPAHVAAQADRVDLARRADSRAGTEALLKRIGVGPDGAVLPPGRPRERAAMPAPAAAAEPGQAPVAPPLIEIDVE